ncbi:MAG: DUF4242 domain-containing protein [Pseudomonadota bacterium]
MPLYLIERDFAQQLELSEQDALDIQSVNASEGVKWLYSFLSANKRKTYCLYQAADPELIQRAADKAGVPANRIVRVDQFTPPELTQ